MLRALSVTSDSDKKTEYTKNKFKVQSSQSYQHRLLFITERNNWIDFGGAPRRKIAGQERYYDQYQRNSSKRAGVGGRDSEEHRRHESSKRERASQSRGSTRSG